MNTDVRLSILLSAEDISFIKTLIWIYDGDAAPAPGQVCQWVRRLVEKARLEFVRGGGRNV